MPHLPMLECPTCGKLLYATCSGSPPPATSFDKCERRCDICGVGYSNSRTDPTVIYKNPLDNVPQQVRQGLLQTADLALNVGNRPNKKRKLGFSTSEDAVTWTIFSHIVTLPQTQQAALYSKLLGWEVTGAPTLHLWGVPVPQVPQDPLRARVKAISTALGEDPNWRTEPDVIVDFGADGIGLMEVKYNSGHDLQKPNEKPFELYTKCRGPGADAFVEPMLATRSQMYELVRNWRFAWELAGGRRTVLVYLGPAALFAPSKNLADFQASLTRPAEGGGFQMLRVRKRITSRAMVY